MHDTVFPQIQVFAIAFSTTVTCVLIMVVLQSLIPTIDTALTQGTITLIALFTGVSVGLIALTLARRKTKQIYRNLEQLKIQFEAVAQGNLISPVIDLSPELIPLLNSFQEMAEAIKNKLIQAQEKAEVQAKQNEYLEDKLMEIIRNLDLTDDHNLVAEVITNDQDESHPTTPAGSLLEFLDNFHKWSQLPTAPELLLGSSSIEEIQQRQDQLQYRLVWLQAILEETQREIKLISPITQLAQTNHLKKSNEG